MPSADKAAALAQLDRLASAWRARVDGPAHRAMIAVLAASTFGLAHLARLGTPGARIGAAFGIAAVAAACVARWVSERRGWRRPEWVLTRTVTATDPLLGEKALRAFRLVDRAADDRRVGSPELARAHLERTLARANPEAVQARAASRGRLLGVVFTLALLAGGTALVVGPARVLEGLDVLLARRGVAPLPLGWLDEPSLVGHPPEYLHQHDITPDDLAHVELPYGSLLTIRGVPLRAGRKLVLIDGTNEIPFVDDGSGGVVARWPLTANARLRVAARFGGVLIPEPASVEVTAIADEPPQVTLQGAPRTLKLLESPQFEIDYEATDDHGLREVQLVLQSAGREERRVLARLDGETRKDHGGHRLWATDKFFKRTYAPVQITVEARDNDPLRGPKWGKSAAITVIPPVVGEPEALRYLALERGRNAFVDLAAFRIEHPLEESLGRAQLHGHAAEETSATNVAAGELERALEESYGGLTVARRLKTLAAGQLRKLREGAAKEAKATTRANHEANRKLAEDFALTLDSALRRLDAVDAATIAKRLAEVADDAAEGAVHAARPAEKEPGLVQLQSGIAVLVGGGGELQKLGTLGRDLGEIVLNDVRRATRARESEDFVHTELALRDLAARLRRPAPSFGGGNRKGGVEAGGSGDPSDGDPSDGAGQQIAREQEQIEELARDHAAEAAGVEQALNSAESGDELDKLREEAKRHADAVRDAVRSLPRSPGAPNTAESAAAAAREHGEAMAAALERGNPADAVKSGRNSASALEQAQRAPADRFSFRGNPHEDAKRASDKLEPEVRWAERALERLRQAASSRAGDDLRKTAPREGKLADRARSLGREGSSGAGALPGPTLDLLEQAESAMREGARALGAADGERALERLKEAQRALEMARSGNEGDEGQEPGEGEPPNGERDGADARGSDTAHRAPIPKAEDYKGPEAFRRRVLEGLAGASDPRLKEAIKRYAEGLLR